MGRTTTHRGRYLNRNHNDRNFNLEKAEHIDKTKISENVTWNWIDGKTFREGEVLFYRENFKELIKDINERAEKSRHLERKTSPAKLLESKKTMPEEVIYQIGSKNEPVEHTVDDLRAVHREFLEWHEEKFGKHVKLLNSALHMDEKVPHFQDRMVWTYTDKGVVKIGQEKALEQLGYDLPDPSRNRGRYNNRKMVYTAECRAKWLDLCEQHNIQVEKNPDKTRVKDEHNLQKNDAIIMQQQKYISSLNRENEELRKENIRLKEKNTWYRKDNERVENECGDLSQQRKELRADIKALEGQISNLRAEYDKISKEPPKPRYIDVERIVEVPKEVEVIKEVEINYKTMFQKCFNAFQKLVDWIDSKFHCMNDFYGELGQDMDFLQTWKTAYPRSRAKVEPLHPDGEESSQNITLSRGGR